MKFWLALIWFDLISDFVHWPDIAACLLHNAFPPLVVSASERVKIDITTYHAMIVNRMEEQNSSLETMQTTNTSWKSFLLLYSMFLYFFCCTTQNNISQWISKRKFGHLTYASVTLGHWWDLSAFIAIVNILILIHNVWKWSNPSFFGPTFSRYFILWIFFARTWKKNNTL